MENELTTVAMQIILAAGDARMYIHEAVVKASENNLEAANEFMKKANEKISEAHSHQTGIVQSEAAGEHYEYSLLMTHAMDTLMTIVSEWNITANMFLLTKGLKIKK